MNTPCEQKPVKITFWQTDLNICTLTTNQTVCEQYGLCGKVKIIQSEIGPVTPNSLRRNITETEIM